MIQCEHFIYAQFNGVGYRLIKSPNVDAVLSEKRLTMLCRLGGGLKGEAYIRMWLPDEGLLSFTYLRPTKDEFDRAGVWNHTILINAKDFLDKLAPEIMASFNPHFIRELDRPPRSLEPLKVEAK